jgi:hypothetical protein
LNRQQQYDEAVARLKRSELLAEASDWVSRFPLKKMIDFGWLPEQRSKEEKAEALLSRRGSGKVSCRRCNWMLRHLNGTKYFSCPIFCSGLLEEIMFSQFTSCPRPNLWFNPYA